MRQSLWTRNFTLVILATTLGSAGGIAGSFALSFLVFDETGSTLASALILAVQLVPHFVVPLFAAPWMDRMPRKPVLVGGDLFNGVLYGAAGIYLMIGEFHYLGYLGFSLLLAAQEAFDQLAYHSIYPKLIPTGQEEKGYAVSATLYPVLKVVLTPVAAVLVDTVGVAWILLMQGGLSLVAAAVESRIRLVERVNRAGAGFSLRVWRADIREAADYLGQEKGLRAMYSYMAVTNGMASGYAPLLVAFFRTMPGMSAFLYGLFSVAEFVGRTFGGVVQYRMRIPKEKKYGFALFVYQFYEVMDLCLLWLPYPLMLLNRASAGFLGVNSATMRQAAVQRYLPEQFRARINAFESMCIMATSSLCSLGMGALGEVMDIRLCVTIGAVLTLGACWATIGRNRREVEEIYRRV